MADALVRVGKSLGSGTLARSVEPPGLGVAGGSDVLTYWSGEGKILRRGQTSYYQS